MDGRAAPHNTTHTFRQHQLDEAFHLVSVEDELGDNAGQTAEHVSPAIDYNCLGRNSRHSSENIEEISR